MRSKFEYAKALKQLTDGNRPKPDSQQIGNRYQLSTCIQKPPIFELVNIGIITYCVFSAEYILLSDGRGDRSAIFNLIISANCRPAYHFVQSSPLWEKGANYD